MEAAFVPVALAAALSGCVLAPRPDAAADEVFRNAAGEAVEVPWDWAVKGSEVEKLKSSGRNLSTLQPFNLSTLQPFNSPEGGAP